MMKTTRFCNLSFYSVHPISEDMGETGVMNFRIQHRCQEVEGKMGRVTEDVASSVVSRVFAVPVTTFQVPELWEFYVSLVLLRLDLGSAILRDVSPRIFSIVGEVLGSSGGDGFWLVVELDIWTRNESGYGDDAKDEDEGWRAVDGGLDRGEDGGGEEDEDGGHGSESQDEDGEDGEGSGGEDKDGEDSESKHKEVEDGEDNGGEYEDEDSEDSGSQDEAEDSDDKNKLDIVNEGMTIMHALTEMRMVM